MGLKSRGSRERDTKGAERTYEKGVQAQRRGRLVLGAGWTPVAGVPVPSRDSNLSRQLSGGFYSSPDYPWP